MPNTHDESLVNCIIYHSYEWKLTLFRMSWNSSQNSTRPMCLCCLNQQCNDLSLYRSVCRNIYLLLKDKSILEGNRIPIRQHLHLRNISHTHGWQSRVPGRAAPRTPFTSAPQLLPLVLLSGSIPPHFSSIQKYVVSPESRVLLN